MNDIYNKIVESMEYIKNRINVEPKVALILGSGLGDFVDEIEDSVEISYKDIPNFPQSTVKGHAGKLVIGSVCGKNVIAMNGRFHYYEGYSMEQVTFPIRVFKLLGVETIVMITASGAVNKELNVGDLVIIDDYIKLTAQSPLRGENLEEFGPRFLNMYSDKNEVLKNKMEQVMKKLDVSYSRGIFAFMAGPQYESRAEIEMLRRLGADIVAMSTVPELIVARHCDMTICPIACVTNSTSNGKNLSHEEVLIAAQNAKEKLTKVLKIYLEENIYG